MSWVQEYYDIERNIGFESWVRDEVTNELWKKLVEIIETLNEKGYELEGMIIYSSSAKHDFKPIRSLKKENNEIQSYAPSSCKELHGFQLKKGFMKLMLFRDLLLLKVSLGKYYSPDLNQTTKKFNLKLDTKYETDYIYRRTELAKENVIQFLKDMFDFFKEAKIRYDIYE